MTSRPLYSLMVHTVKHSSEELILSKDLFSHLQPGEYVQLLDPYRPSLRLILRVPALQTAGGTLEVSLSKTVAEPLDLKPFSRIHIERVAPEEAEVDFVELTFRRQFLQRGYMWRFKSDMFGRPVHIGQTVTAVGGVQAQVQELGINGTPTISGVISERTHFVFRSRSARIIWLVQISSEMWEYDQNGDLYFEKFLNQFADPLFDRWKSLGVTHSLTIVFFARTLYLDGVDPVHTPDLCCKASLQRRSDGVLYQDFFKVVLENSSEVDKVAHLRMLKKEFWAFPKNVGWNIEKNRPEASATGTYTTPSSNTSGRKRPIAVPSDALNGNVLEAINTTLNLLDKHYIDRDLLRTGNSIVMISAGVGMFKVKPTIALISKQRMMDTGIGLDFISLSQPPLHFVPLFLYCCSEEGLGDFYVVPQWINVCYVDCIRDSSATVENATSSTSLVTPCSPTGSTSKAASANYLWTGLEEYGGVITSNRNKDKEVEKVYHNIHSISNNGGSIYPNRGDAQTPESSNGDEFVWGEGFTPQPFSSILKGHLHGKSGFAPPPLRPLGVAALAPHSSLVLSDVMDKGCNVDYRHARYYEEKGNTTSIEIEDGYEGCININDVERNKSLVHAYALPVPLKRALISESKIIYPAMSIVTAAIDAFALNVQLAWCDDHGDDAVNDDVDAIKEILSASSIVATNTLHIPQWGYFSFQEASKAISRLTKQLTSSSSSCEGRDRGRDYLDNDNDTDKEFQLLKHRSVSFSDEGYCNDGSRNSYGAHTRPQSFTQNNHNSGSHNSQYYLSKKEILRKEVERDGDRAGSSYTMVSFVNPSPSNTDAHHHRVSNRSMSTAGTGGGQHDRDRDKDKDIQSVTENYQVGSLASSYCDKEIEENMASSINSQMSSIISDCDEERGRGRGREDGLSAHKRLVRGNKTHQDSFGDSDGGSEGADLFSMIACGEVKDNKALRDLIRKHDAQHSVFSSSKHKSHPSRDLMGVDEKKAKDREKDRERERERIISISANGSLSRTFRGFGGSSNMSIATYLEPPALQLSQRPISAASAGVGYGGIPHGAARGFEENNSYLHNHRYEPRRSPERKVRADSLHEGSSPRPRRRFGSGLSEESDTGSVVSFADVITVHENEREVIPVSMTAFPTEGCYAASIASLRPFVANRSEGVDSIPISDIRGENDRKRSSETLAPSVVANGSIGGSITVVSKRPQKACRNISSSANDRPINPTKYLMTQQYSDPSDLGSAASSSNSLSFNRDVSTLKADVPGSAFISDTSSELILSDMIDIEGDASRGEVLSCGSSVGIGILVGDVSSHGLGSFMTTESICNSSGKAEERGDEMISDGRERSDSGNVLYLKDYLSSACDRELKVEGEEEEQGVMASEVEGDIMVNQRVHRKSAALHIVPDAAGQDKSALSMRDAAPVEECDVKFSAESHSLNVAELLTLGSTFIRKWLGNKSVIDSSGGKGKGRSEGQSTGPLQDCEDSALSACITANARVAGNILTPATSGAVNLMSLGAAGGGGGGAAAASGSSSLVNRVGTNGSKIEIGFEGSDSRRSSIEKTKEYHNSHVGSAPSNHQYSSSPSQFISPSQHPSSSSHYMHHHSSTAIKPPRGHDTSKDNLKTNYVYDKKEAMRQFVMKFRARYEVNPFRKEDGSGFLKTRTHNRRRWSHIFPAGKLEMVGYYGLNWKSLSQPAILPSSTDFLVPLSELKDEDKFEIQGNYSLIMDPTECAFDAPENLLTEMICQRLAQEYQLVQGVDLRPYRNYIMQNYNLATNSSNGLQNGELFFVLSMGHRIQFLVYDPALRRVNVTRLLAKHGSYRAGTGGNELTDTYTYEIWIPQTGCYATMQQQFSQFPAQEYAWNLADEILLGNMNVDTSSNNSVRAKRLRFAVIPDVITTDAESDIYFSKIERLVQFFRKYCSDGDKESVKVCFEKTSKRHLNDNLTAEEGKIGEIEKESEREKEKDKDKNRKKKVEVNLLKIWLGTKGDPKWAFLQCDRLAGDAKVMHVELHWTSCDSWLMDEFVSVLFIRAKGFGLRIAQIPEVFVSPNLELNPFRSLPYITVQLPSAIVSNNVNRRASKEASLPSLFHMYTKDISLPMSNSSSTLNFRRLPSSSSKHLLPSNATATAAAATNGCYSTDKQTSTTAVPAFSAASFDYLCYSSVVTVVERLYFLSLPHASEWVEDEEQHTDWAVSSFFLSHAPGLSPMSVPIPAIDRLSMGLKSNHPNATGAGTGAHNIAQAHFDASEVGSMSDKESSIRTGCNNYSDIVFPMEQSISSASTRTPVYPLSLTLPREFERNDGLLNRGLYLNRRSEENSNPRLNRDSNRDYTNSEGSMTTMTVSPVKGSNPVSTLPLSLRSNKTQNNQFPSPVPSSSPLISAYGKTLGVTSLGPALSPSPSWRLREREKDRGARTGTGGISGLIRMQSMGTTGQSHSHGHVGVGGHNNNSQSTGHLLGHLNPGTAGGGMDVRAMIGEAKRRSDQRLNTDHQYLHRMAYACVRVGPNGFVWLSNNTGKVSDLNLSAERENLNLKKQKEFRSFCDSVSICYEVVLDIVEHSLLLVAERNIDESIKSSTCVSNIGVSRGLEEENAVRGTEEISKRDQAQTNALASILDFPVSEGDVVQLHTPISILPTAGAGAGTGVYTTPSAGSKAIVSYVLEGEGAVSADRTGLSHGESFGLRSNGQVIQGNDSLDSDPHHGLILSDFKSSLTHQKCDELDGINIGTERVDEGIRKDRDQFESYNYSNSCSPSPLTPETSIIESPSP